MKIAAFTVGDINVASSRLRSYYLFSLGEEFGLKILRPTRLIEALECDVIHIQKILSLKIIIAIILYRLHRKLVIFDIDDQPGKKIKSFLGCLLIMYLASVITVDSEYRKIFWDKYLFYKKIIVINDVADTNDMQPTFKIRKYNFDKINFIWIGHKSNIASIEKFIELLKIKKNFQLIICTNDSEIPNLIDKYPHINFLGWNKEIMFDNSIEAQFMILNHNFDHSSNLKSDNKMVLAVLAGFIPIVSRTPSYSKLASELDANYLVFDSFYEVFHLSEIISQGKIELFNKDNLNFIIANYSRKAVLSKFISQILI